MVFAIVLILGRHITMSIVRVTSALIIANMDLGYVQDQGHNH